MLPPSKANAGQPQVVPGKIWVATLCSILFLVAYAAIIFTQPDRLREAMYVTAEPSVVSLDELAKDKSRDPRNANLRGIRVETMDEKETRDGSLDGVHQVHPIGDLGESETLKLFVFAPGALLPGSDEDETSGGADLRSATELSGVLRRPNPLAYRTGFLQDDCGISHDAWMLLLDTKPYAAGETLVIGGLSLLLGALMLMAMMSQNWIPNRGVNLQVLFALLCMIGWPLRRWRQRWSVRMMYLAIGIGLVGGGYGLVGSGDRGIVIDAYWLEYWAAAIGLVMLGLAMVFRVAWVVCRKQPAVSSATVDAIVEPDDERPARDRPFTKFVASVRTVSGGVAVALFVARIINNAAGCPVPILADPCVGYGLFTAMITYSCSYWLLISITRGFSERAYELIEKAPRGLTKYRSRSDNMLEMSGFESHGTYRVRGSAFQTTIELHLGCRGMVIAEFISLSGKNEIELHTILESGMCIATASCKAPDGKPATRWSETFYSHAAGTHDFEELLRSHLGAAADLAEQHHTAVAVLTKDDVIDVIKCSNRAFHDMLFQQGETKDRVGPASYGRFRFPTGLIESTTDSGQSTDSPPSEQSDFEDVDQLVATAQC